MADFQRPAAPARRLLRLGVAFTLTPLLFAVLASAPAADLPQAPPLPESAELGEQGLALTFEGLSADAGAAPDTRTVRLVSLYVAEGTPPTPFVPAGRFRATWTGELNLKLRERFGFRAEGRGKLTVTVKDKVVLDASGDDLSKTVGEVVRLDKGKNPIVVKYESPEAGDASVRLIWFQKETLPEPIVPTAFTHNANAKPTLEGIRLREGRQLLADLRCMKCHEAPRAAPSGDAAAASAGASGAIPADDSSAAPAGMPELAMDAPSLKDVGARLNRDWMAVWINDPKSVRPDAHMPRIFHGATDGAGGVDSRAMDVAAYLASLGGDGAAAPAAAAPAAEKISAGGFLFASLNCIACHTAPDATAAGTDRRLSLAHLAAKFKPEGLYAYLLKPEAHYAWNPMPNFKLSGDEAAQLAGFLLARPQKAVEVAAGGAPPNVENGRQLVRNSGCLNCHVAQDATAHKAPALAAIPADAWARGCMAADAAARKAAPDYALPEPQRTALLAFAATDRTSLGRDNPAEFSARQIASLNCTACHARDGREPAINTSLAGELAALTAAYPPPAPGGAPTPAGGAPAGDAHATGEHIAPDQRAPLLTWAGEKLRPEWAAKFIAGDLSYKPRYYLRARMPAWPARAALLAQGLALEHGCPPATAAYSPPDEALASEGQKLIGAAGGFSCTTCHATGPPPALAPFEAPALNFMYVTERLRKDYYMRWMHNPIKVDPATKMPQFGDAAAHEKLWQFLLRGKDVTPPGQ